MTTDELLKKLPSFIGRNPIYNEDEIIGYATDENKGVILAGFIFIMTGKAGMPTMVMATSV